MNRRLLFWTVALTAMTIAVPLLAGRLDEVHDEVPAAAYKGVEMNVEFSAGRIDIAPSSSDLPVQLDALYLARYIDYDFDYEDDGGVCRVFAKSEFEHHRGRDYDDIDNEWNVDLSTKYPLNLDFELGACEGIFDLGGLKIEEIMLEVGAADLEIDFSAPNPVRMREFNANCGASSLVIDGLANANVDHMDFDIGAGSCDIDFRGDFKGETEVTIDVGVGSMDVIVPRNVAILIRGDAGMFSSLDISGLDVRETRRDTWESDDFDTAKDRLIFDVSIGIGSVDIKGR